ncbi:substrate-binding domain-containing protein [Paenibacillus arenosi]|uniref:Helix-turn-helix transcriptional regulator n=1 Tax=Paenibacillus arenosi TaxID=2774142 RepID=A0ABR9AUI3_9BACL|nr:helix-turn-helix transcriptional regulator [Paenibacillus arenosi]
MSNPISYTTEEIAALLKVSKLTVYDLIKKGELPSYRVGKQMRVDAEDLESYKQRAKGIARASQAIKPEKSLSAASQVLTHGARPIIITGQDISLDILARHIEQNVSGVRPLRSYSGSMDSLIAMYRGESDIVSTHLLDGDSGEYNLPYIRRVLVSSSYVVVNLLSRSAGMFVQQGNPLHLNSWADLNQTGVRIVNREKGSGARVLLDEQLRLHGIQASQLTGYDTEATNHIGVASKVASGEANVGVGIEKAASIVSHVDFIPLIQERYDLVLMKKAENLHWIESVIAILQSETFQNELRSIGGYDLSLTGQVLYES